MQKGYYAVIKTDLPNKLLIYLMAGKTVVPLDSVGKHKLQTLKRIFFFLYTRQGKHTHKKGNYIRDGKAEI